MIVSCNEYSELGGDGILGGIVTPEEWKGIDHHLLPWPDFSVHIKDSLLLQTLDKMRLYVQQNRSIYLHCKAGRARSLMLAILHLLDLDCRNGTIDVNKLSLSKHDLEILFYKKFHTIQAIRPHIINNRKKREKTIALLKIMIHELQKASQKKQNLLEHTYENPPSINHDPYTLFLRDLVQSIAFKTIAIAASTFTSKEHQQNSATQTLLNNIYTNKANWYHNFIQTIHKHKPPSHWQALQTTIDTLLKKHNTTSHL